MNFILNFDTDDELREFQARLARTKETFFPGRPLNDLQFFTLLLQKWEAQEPISVQNLETNGKPLSLFIEENWHNLGDSKTHCTPVEEQ